MRFKNGYTLMEKKLQLRSFKNTLIHEQLLVIQGWEENKPWLPKERVDELLDDKDKFKTWLKEKETEQTKTSAFSTPAFTSEEVYRKLLDLEAKVDSINKIPKPKPKVEKPVKNETASSGEDVKDSNSTSQNTSQGDKPATESDAPPDEKVEAEVKNRDELQSSWYELQVS
ncbi:hypothetical protein SLA2020_053050 [Shorea laevis]